MSPPYCCAIVACGEGITIEESVQRRCAILASNVTCTKEEWTARLRHNGQRWRQHKRGECVLPLHYPVQWQ